MTTTRELSVCLRQPRWRPLADTDCVKWALDMSAKEIEQLIDLGRLVVFDIAVNLDSKSPLMSHRRELRFLTRSIVHYQLTAGTKRLELSWPEIARAVLPDDKPELTAVEIDSALNCDSNHRMNLIRAGELEPRRPMGSSREELWCRGRNCGVAVVRASVERFLKRRLL